MNAETVGVRTCPVYEEGATRREDRKVVQHSYFTIYVQSSNISGPGLYMWGLPTLALPKSRSAAPGTKVSPATPGRPKHSIVHVKPERTVVERKHNMFVRGPWQWSVRGAGSERKDPKNPSVGFQPQAVLQKTIIVH